MAYDTPRAIADRITDRIIAAQSGDSGSGYATVGGKRVNYQDIGTAKDPMSNRGGYSMTSGAVSVPDDPELGAAVRDAQNRQASLDAAGVGTSQTLGQRLGGIRGGGMGAIVNAVMQSKVAKDDRIRAVGDRNFGLAVDDMQAKNAYNSGMLDYNRSKAPLDAEKDRSAIELNRAKASKAEWDMSPEGIAAKRRSDGKLSPEQEAEMKAIDTASAALRATQASALGQEDYDTRVTVPGAPGTPATSEDAAVAAVPDQRGVAGPAYFSKRNQYNEQRRSLQNQIQRYREKYGQEYTGSAAVTPRQQAAQPKRSQTYNDLSKEFKLR